MLLTLYLVYSILLYSYHIIRLTWNFNEMSTSVYDAYDDDIKQTIETYRNNIPVGCIIVE